MQTEATRFNYEAIKMLAAERKCKTEDLMVLARNNDPFYVGTDAHWRDAEWFKNVWQNFEYQHGSEIHLRRIHYRLISQKEPIMLPSGLPYINTNKCWGYLGIASKYARWLNLVDPAAFDDRRNGKPKIFIDEEVIFSPSAEIYDSLEFGFEFPDLPDLPGYSIFGFKPEQPYHLEVWCEKSTMNDVLEPFCEEYGVNLITGLGEFSITACLWLVDRVNTIGKPCRILYISDFDPAGQSMPVAVARKIEKLIIDRGNQDTDIKLLPLVLTMEQIQKYKLPRTPIKESERRAASFEDRFGSGATELDALEALCPGELHKIIKEAVLGYYDPDLAECVNRMEDDARQFLNEIQNNVINRHKENISAIKTQYAGIKDEFQNRIIDLESDLERVWQAIQEELNDDLPAFNGFEIMTKPGVDVVNPLFDSKRHYFEQLSSYKHFQGK